MTVVLYYWLYGTSIVHVPVHLITSLLYMYLQSPDPSALSSVFHFLSSFSHTLWLLSHISTSFLQHKMNLTSCTIWIFIWRQHTSLRLLRYMDFKTRGFSQNLTQWPKHVFNFYYNLWLILILTQFDWAQPVLGSSVDTGRSAILLTGCWFIDWRSRDIREFFSSFKSLSKSDILI